MLVKTFNEYELQEEFRRFDRDYYSLDGYRAILEYFETTDCEEDVNLDVIGICGDFTEESPENIWNDYNNHEDIKDAMDEDGNIDTYKLMDALIFYTYAMELPNGNILYINF